MEIEKALALNLETERSLREHKFYDFADAVKMGNEALDCIRLLRFIPDNRLNLNLPGETQDYCKFCGLPHTDIECPNREREK